MTPRRATLLRVLGLALLIAAVIVLSVALGRGGIDNIRADVAGLGAWGGVAYAAGYAVACLSPAPKTVFTLAAGALFGLPAGLAVVVVGATIGAMLGFWLARWLGRGVVLRLLGARGARFDAQVTQRGVWTILVARLIPFVPFTTVNYLSGVTAVRPRDFLLGTAIGIVPTTTAAVAVGAFGGEPGSWPFLAAVGGLVLLTLGGLAATWWRRRRIG